MRLVMLLMKRDRFQTEDQIKKHIVHSKKHRPGQENPAEAELMCLFKSSRQQTWLVSTSHCVYFIVDDLKKDAPHISWSRRKEQLLDHKSRKPKFNIFPTPQNKRTGRVNLQLGDTVKGWLYSRSMYDEPAVKSYVSKLIMSP